eukprot:6145831-Prymnesium_polylepis.1
MGAMLPGRPKQNLPASGSTSATASTCILIGNARAERESAGAEKPMVEEVSIIIFCGGKGRHARARWLASVHITDKHQASAAACVGWYDAQCLSIRKGALPRTRKLAVAAWLASGKCASTACAVICLSQDLCSQLEEVA